jgi:hypothetical protein
MLNPSLTLGAPLPANDPRYSAAITSFLAAICDSKSKVTPLMRRCFAALIIAGHLRAGMDSRSLHILTTAGVSPTSFAR